MISASNSATPSVLPCRKVGCVSVKARWHYRLPAYRLNQATVTFPNGSPFDPTVQAQLETRMQGYDVTMQASGRLLDPRLQINTTPPLSASDALILATVGQRPQEINEGGASGALASTLPYLGRELYRFIVGDDTTDEAAAAADRLNIAMDEDRSEDGQSTIRVDYRFKGPYHVFVERDRWEELNGGLLYRWQPGRPFNDGAAKKTAAEWDIIGAPIQQIKTNDKADKPAQETELALSGRAMRRAIRPPAIAYAENPDPAHLSDAQERLRQLFVREGYRSANVTVAHHLSTHETPETSNTLNTFNSINTTNTTNTITFVVDQGPRHIIGGRQLLITDDQALSPAVRETIAAQFASNAELNLPLTATRIGFIEQAIRGPLKRAGHTTARVSLTFTPMDPTIHQSKENNDNLLLQAELTIAAGPIWRVATPNITWQAADHLSSDLQQRISQEILSLDQTIWSRRELARVRATALQYLLDAGYADATLNWESERPEWSPATSSGDSDQADTASSFDELPESSWLLASEVIITPGPQHQLHDIVFVGNDRTRESVLLHRLNLTPDVLLTQPLLDQATQRLARGGLFTSIEYQLEPAENQANHSDNNVQNAKDEKNEREEMKKMKKAKKARKIRKINRAPNSANHSPVTSSSR